MDTRIHDPNPADAPDPRAPHAYSRRIDCGEAPRDAVALAPAQAPVAARADYHRLRKGDCA